MQPTGRPRVLFEMHRLGPAAVAAAEPLKRDSLSAGWMINEGRLDGPGGKSMRCSSCGNDNREGRKFCVQCGQLLRLVCPSCGAPAEPGERFCGDCGAGLVAADAQPASARSPAASASDNRIPTEQAEAALKGERKTVTALFADIKGSTELERDLDPEDARAIVDPVLQLMIAAVHRYDGYVAQSTGDGIFALFGAPVAHEDHAQRALHAALAMQQELRLHGERLKNQGRSPVEARIGVNTGEVVMRTIQTGAHPEYTPVGHVTNLAARMQTAAPTGSIAASEATQRLCEGYFEFRALGPTAVKGLNGLVEVYEVLRAGPLRTHFQLAAQRGLTKFVGRERELTDLKRALELARSGHGQIVAAVAEAGTGKSRLVYEFKAAIPGGHKVLEAYSVSTGKAAAYQPVLELFHNYFGIEASDDPARRREKIAARLATLDPALGDIPPYLFALLGMQDASDPLAALDPSVRRRRTLDALRRIVLRESVNQPLVVIFEDLHWIDSQTQALLDLLADSIASARVLLLVNYRPEYRHQWAGKSYYTQLGLGPLGDENAKELLAALLGDATDLAALKRLIAEKCGGNPFFTEELVRGLFEEGVLTRNGNVRMTRPLSHVRVPATVQAVLGSRIDRLPAEAKSVLQTLAVIGKDIPLDLARCVTDIPDDELSRVCSDLQIAEFIYEQPSAAGVAYTFKHALTQEVAYNSLLLERRKVLHGRIGDAIEALYPEGLDDHLTELAHHYGRSADLRKAVHYLRRGGNQALERAAHTEAQTLLSRGLELLKDLPHDSLRVREEIDLQTALGFSLFYTKSPAAPEREVVLLRAKELCEQLGDEARLIRALVFLANLGMNRLELQSARNLAQQAVALTTHVTDSALVAEAHWPLGEVLFWMGEFPTSRQHLERTLEILGQGPYRNFREAAYAKRSAEWLVEIAALCGYPDTALKRTGELLSAARRSSDNPALICIALETDARLSRILGDARKMMERAEEILALATDHDMRFWMLLGKAWRGSALAAVGQVKEGIAELQRAREAVAAYPLALLIALARLAEACLLGRRPEEGLEVVADGLVLAHKSEAGLFQPELYLTKGELLLLQNGSNAAGAEDCFRQAILIARGQTAKFWELRATTSLARLLMRQGKRDEASAILAEIYGWFTEGFDTADLEDAKTLLDELSA
jgi:class 3 adenylate cyclase/tetratricopeptide (TPR) repeat protein